MVSFILYRVYGAEIKLSGVQYGTCSKWGKDGRPVSDWAQSWFNLYIDNKECRELKPLVKDTVCDKE